MTRNALDALYIRAHGMNACRGMTSRRLCVTAAMALGHHIGPWPACQPCFRRWKEDTDKEADMQVLGSWRPLVMALGIVLTVGPSASRSDGTGGNSRHGGR